MDRCILASLLLSLILCTGCGGPARLDSSNQVKLKASFDRLTAKMSPSQKRQFIADCMETVSSERSRTALKNTVATEMDVVKNSHLFSTINGLTAAEIHLRAERRRYNNERAKKQKMAAAVR